MNKIILMGRFVRDPEIKIGSTTLAKFSTAVDRRFKRDGDPEADFFNCTAFGKQAEFIEKYCKQGTKVLLTGRIQDDNYTAKDGSKVYSKQVIVEEIEFAESKGSSNTETKTSAKKPDSDGFMSIPDGVDEELPFN